MKRIWLLLFVLAVCLVVVAYFTKPIEKLHRSFVSLFSDTWQPTVRLLSCSNVTHQILWSESTNIESIPADVDGWTILRPGNPNLPAVVVVSFLKDRNELIYYPRLSGVNCSVNIYEITGQHAYKLLAKATQRENAWTDIGRQARIDLLCLEHGFVKNEYTATIRLVMLGVGSQLWLKGSDILF